MEHRPGVVVDSRVTQATAILGPPRLPLGADKNDDTRDRVRELRALRVTPHVAQHTTGRASAIEGRTARHPGSAVSQWTRTWVEEVLGWLKTDALLRKARHRGVARVGWMFTCAAAVYNLVRICTLAAVA